VSALAEDHNPSIPRIAQQWKGAVTKKAEIPLWQDRFDDRVVYNAASIRRIEEYIQNNPTRWKDDVFYEPDISC